MDRFERTKKFIDVTKVEPGAKIRLEDWKTGWAQNEEAIFLGKGELKERAQRLLDENRAQLAEAQELLYANHTYAILIILQGRDAAGKDGIIKHVMSGVNPQGCRVVSFKQPSAAELAHDFLWRQVVELPERGMIGIFNRSHYEEVLVVRVHPNFLERQNLPPGKRNEEFWKERFEDISNFERYLVRNGTLILKFFLNVSKEEQRKRFLERLDVSDKNWKFSAADLEERDYWDEYSEAYEDMLNNTSTKCAPWFIIPADYKWFARSLVADIITTSIFSLDIKWPVVDEQKCKAIEAAKIKLQAK
jgi:PPK2 family polyphosphate:nucleotide phosphotransferase